MYSITYVSSDMYAETYMEADRDQGSRRHLAERRSAPRLHAATAVICCAPGQGPVCDYQVHASDSQNEAAQKLDWSAKGDILQHHRRASVWALVAKVASWAAQEAEKQ